MIHALDLRVEEIGPLLLAAVEGLVCAGQQVQEALLQLLCWPVGAVLRYVLDDLELWDGPVDVVAHPVVLVPDEHLYLLGQPVVLAPDLEVEDIGLLPALGASALFAFISAWNEFFFALVLMKSQELITLPVDLARFTGMEGQARMGPLAAASIISTIPSLVLFAFLQKSFSEGLLSGAVKE